MTSKKENPVCLRCSGHMEPGIMSDVPINTFQRFGMRHLWVDGDARPLKNIMGANKDLQKLSGKKFYVNEFRCTLCGYLELYANKEA